MTSLMKKATPTRKIEVSNKSPLIVVDYKNRQCKYDVTGKYLRENNLKNKII